MIRPICYNIPEGKSEQEALPDELLEGLDGVFQGVTNAFGDNAILYRLDIGRVYESVQSGDLVVAGQFVDRSDGEVFDFEINQGTGKVSYKSTGDFLDQSDLISLLSDDNKEKGENDSFSEIGTAGLHPRDLFLKALTDITDDRFDTPELERLRNDINSLGVLSALLFLDRVSLEAVPLYSGMHKSTIMLALNQLRVITCKIGLSGSNEAQDMAEAWVDEHGLDYSWILVRNYASAQSDNIRERVRTEAQDFSQELNALTEEAIERSVATTTSMIRLITSDGAYRPGDVQKALRKAIDDYCPIDISTSKIDENAKDLSFEWQDVINLADCNEDLSMNALGLPSTETYSSERLAIQDFQTGSEVDNHSDVDATQGGDHIFYVNVGEGPSRNWDDCRKFGFLAAGGGRKWSKQLEKIKTGDTVIAYLKGYGYVGIGKVTTTATPATKFTVNGVPIKDLPLINDTIRSIKRFSKENGEYLIGVHWQAAVAREQAAWQANAGLYTTALVCASLGNQPVTISFAKHQLLNTSHAHIVDPSQGCEDSKYGSHPNYANVEINRIQSSLMESASQQTPLTCESAIMSLKAALIQAEEDDLDTDDVMRGFTNLEWQSDDEFLDFFEQVSIEIAQSASRDPDQETAEIFGRPIYYGLSLGSPYFSLWEQAFKTSSLRLTEMINIEEWETDIAREIEELSLIMMIPLAAAYELPIFESLRNRVIIDPSEAEEEFLGYVAAALAPGYFEGTLPPEILNIPSARVLCEILEDWSQYRDLWNPSVIEDFLSSKDSANYISKETRGLIARVLRGEDPYNPDEWERHKEEYWSEDEIQEVISLCEAN